MKSGAIGRRLLRTSCREKITNDEALNRINTTDGLFNIVHSRKLPILRHVLRRDSLDSILLTGMGIGKRGKGRPKTMYGDNIQKFVVNLWLKGKGWQMIGANGERW